VEPKNISPRFSGNQKPFESYTTNARSSLDQTEIDLFIVKMLSSKSIQSNHSVSRENMSSISPRRIHDEPDAKHSKSSPGRLNFEQFLKVIEFIAMKVFPETDDEESMQQLIEQYLSKIPDEKLAVLKDMDTKIHLKKLMKILKEPAVVDILGKLKKSLHPYYSLYCEEDSNMDFQHFIKFCRDFEIFPHILPRGKLMELFYNLASLHPYLSKQRDTTQPSNTHLEESPNPTIDENLFVEALALCAAEIEDGISAHIVDKVVYLATRLII